MKKFIVAAALVAALGNVAPAMAKAAPAQVPQPPAATSPKGGVTIVATFSMQAYTYDIYKKALSLEVPLMAKNGVKLLHSYRVNFGGMDKYFDIWWAPDYETAYEAFYNPKVTDPEFDKFLASTPGVIIDPKVEIVTEEIF